MSLYSGQTLVNASLKKLGILEQGGTPNNSDSVDMLELLNYMIQQWHLRNEFVPSVVRTNWPLVANQQSYTIGPSGSDFVGARPTYIEEAYVALPAPAGGANLITFPLKMLSDQEFGDISDSSAVADVPDRLYNDRASPNSTLFLYPAARCTVASKLQLFTWFQLGTFASVASTVDLPDGYAEPVTNALAYRGLAMFGNAVNQAVAQNITDTGKLAEGVIAMLNTKARGLQMPPAQKPPE